MATNTDQAEVTTPAPDLAERLGQTREDAREAERAVRRLTGEWEGAILSGTQDVVLLEKQLGEAKVRAELVRGRVAVLERADAEAKQRAKEEAARKPARPWVDPHSRPGHHLSHDIPAEVMVGPKRIVVRATLEQVLDDVAKYESAEQDDAELLKSIDARLTDLEWGLGGFRSQPTFTNGPKPTREQWAKYHRRRVEVICVNERNRQRIGPNQRWVYN